MPNESGSTYGLTFLSPILEDERAIPSHDLQIRNYLAKLSEREQTGSEQSPFALAPGTHLCRLVVLDDVIYVGMPSCEEHLKSKYLVFEANCDCDLEDYIGGLARGVPQQVDAIWSHCTGYPGVANPQAFVEYMKACQLTTTFFFAAVNDRSVTQTLTALQTQTAVAHFIATHQGLDPATLQREFLAFNARLTAQPPPRPGTNAPQRDIKTGGRNE